MTRGVESKYVRVRTCVRMYSCVCTCTRSWSGPLPSGRTVLSWYRFNKKKKKISQSRGGGLKEIEGSLINMGYLYGPDDEWRSLRDKRGKFRLP